MNRTIRRALGGLLAALLLLGSWWVLAGPGSSEDEELPVLYDAPSFALADQTGDTLRSAELRGTPWVLHVFFTNCRAVCPVTTSRMASLRDSLAARGLLGEEVRLVSVTVDPARDTAAALRAWAERHGADDPADWAFLGGEPPAAVRRLVQEGFHLSAMMPSDTAGDYQVTHGARVLLVDADGRVRRTYPIVPPGGVARLLEDLRRLAG